jgi:hypothetical protein
MTNSLYDNMCVKMDYRYIRAERKPILTAFLFQSRERREEKNCFEHHWIAMRLTIIIHIYIDKKGREKKDLIPLPTPYHHLETIYIYI